MSEQEKILEAVEEYRLSAATFPMKDKPDFNGWVAEIKTGHVKEQRLSNWLKNLANYYGEKDRPFAAYLEGLLQ